jgi:hypothetical protein
MDGGFEGGSPSTYWAEYSLNFGTPLCTAAACGTGTGTGPYSGDWWAWFGGIGAYEEGSVSQSVTIPADAEELTFFVEQVVCDSGLDYLELLIDGNQEFVTYGDDPACGVLGYREIVVDITAYADDAAHTVEFHSEIYADVEGGSNFFVDNVSIYTPDAGDCVPDGISWASSAPLTGVVDPDGSATVDVTFDSTGMEVGYHTGTLCVMSNDSANPEVSVDITMHVVEPVTPTSVSLSSLTGDASSMSLLWLLAGAIGAIAGGVMLLRRRQNRA